MSNPICRVGDCVVGVCEGPGSDHPRDFVGVWTIGSDLITCDGIPVIRVGDMGVTDCNHNFMAVTGSDISTDNGIAIHRVGDVVHVLEGGVGVSTTGSDTSNTE